MVLNCFWSTQSLPDCSIAVCTALEPSGRVWTKPQCGDDAHLFSLGCLLTGPWSQYHKVFTMCTCSMVGSNLILLGLDGIQIPRILGKVVLSCQRHYLNLNEYNVCIVNYVHFFSSLFQGGNMLLHSFSLSFNLFLMCHYSSLELP